MAQKLRIRLETPVGTFYSKTTDQTTYERVEELAHQWVKGASNNNLSYCQLEMESGTLVMTQQMLQQSLFIIERIGEP